jgi:hypothetical protein
MAAWVWPYNSCSETDKQTSLSLGSRAAYRPRACSTPAVLVDRMIGCFEGHTVQSLRKIHSVTGVCSRNSFRMLINPQLAANGGPEHVLGRV